jgi:hypothetical protein
MIMAKIDQGLFWNDCQRWSGTIGAKSVGIEGASLELEWVSMGCFT